MTTLEITPRISDKTARFRGTVAAGEHVAVTIKGGAEWLGDDAGANLTLRVLDLVTGRTLAVFPRPEETLEDGEEPDEWDTAVEDDRDLFCNLNLNTDRMVNAARHMLRVPVLFVMGAKDETNPATTRTLYFRDRYEVEFWPERVGDDTPYDLDKWPKQIDEWTEQVAAWTSRMNNLALDAERVDSGVKITLNDGTLETPKEVVVNDGEVSRNEMNTAIAAMGSAKQNTLTFDAIPTEGSDNPVKSGGVYGAVKEVADAVTEHVANTDIHVTAAQKTAWTAKYDKPSGGIPKSDLAEAVRASLAKADTAVQVHQSLDAYVNAAGYDSDAKEIQLKHDSAVVARIDATAFIKDGMVDSVEISGGNLVISFNTDAGVEDIEIPLTDIFNPANYYDKTAADNRFVQKEAGKSLFSGSYNDLSDKPTIPAPVTIDSALSPTSENPVQNKAVVAALDGKRGLYDLSYARNWRVRTTVQAGQAVYTLKPWPEDPMQPAWRWDRASAEAEPDFKWFTLELHNNVWTFRIKYGDDSGAIVQWQGDINTAEMQFSVSEYEQLDRDYIVQRSSANSDSLALVSDVPTKTSQLANDGAPGGGGTPYATTAQVEAKANASDVNAALAQKASLADLPYRLVEPGKWEFSPSSYDGREFSIVEQAGSEVGLASYLLFLGEEQVGGILDGEPNKLGLVFEAQLIGDPDNPFTVTATRASLPGHLLDRANNLIDATTGNVTLTLPPFVAGKVRDLLVHVNLGDDGTNPYTVTVDFPSGETNTGFKVKGNASAPIPAPDAAGEWLFSFSESSPHKMAVSLAQLQDATVAGGS